MSGRSNDDGGNIAMAFAFVIVGFAVFAMLILAVAVFAAMIMTFLFLFALDEGYDLFGINFSPYEARLFIGGGVGIAVLVMAFAVFCAFFFQIEVELNYLYIGLGGYTAGSFGTLYLHSRMDDDHDPSQPNTIILPPLPRYDGPAQTRHEDEDKAAPFHYGSWDDEEEMR